MGVSPGKPAIVAIDGGNSKTDLALVAADGTVLAKVRGPGMPGRLSDKTLLVIAGLLKSAVIASGAVAGGEPVLTGIATDTVACVANVDLPEEELQLQQMLAAQDWTSSTRVANDTFAVLRAGLDDVPVAGAELRWGVGVTCGAGINCAGVAPDGTSTGYLALGAITGDWGGGGSLGAAAQWAAIRAEDGRGPQTALRELAPAHFGLATPADLAIALHQGKVAEYRLGELAPLVFKVSDSGDEVARAIVIRLAEEVSLMTIAVIRRLRLTGATVPVVLGGSVLAARNSLLIDEITARITAVVPASTVRVIEAAPVAGAALLGLDRIGAPVSAMTRLRQELALA
ncbi:MAG TPA: BadF/BadG/BcrA/BcrD ATPase family protein [Streptosporangiaceae bacterium]|nr:BadF/BadG/BcrA/BcrD ATPase family protein [Streptosporangiaceae bacterium]